MLFSQNYETLYRAIQQEPSCIGSSSGGAISAKQPHHPVSVNLISYSGNLYLEHMILGI